MALAPGSRLGAYEILSPLGTGGMGEVYKARDTRLDRTVAIKVMPPDLAADPQFRARFDREARAISQLQHPHICTLYDVGEVDGTAFLVMEMLQGQTLAGRLEKGALPLDHALKIAIEVADALCVAHAHGIFHRDLKPANIMLTATGAKLLDFGLAKQAAPVVSIGSASAGAIAPTTQVTGVGTILGTPHYMSPEQVEGREADARADVWALGVVIFEMVSGRRPFEGGSSVNIIGAILKDDPTPLQRTQPLVPQALNDIVAECLVKDRDSRWQSARDLASALQWVKAISRPQETGRSRRSAWMLLATAIIAAASAVAVVLRTSKPAPAIAQLTQFVVLPPEGGSFSGDGIAGSNPPSPQIAIAPDGYRLAFIATLADGRPRIWIRSRDSVVAHVLQGTEGAAHPFWSPDGRYIGFFSGAKLKSILADGGPVQVLCDAVNPRGGTWSRDGVIVFAAGFGDGLQRIAAGGGRPAAASEIDTAHQELSHRWPQFLPDGRHFLYLALNAMRGQAGIYVAALDSRERVRVLDSDFHAEFVEPGYLVFAREGGLLAQRFDPQTLHGSGDPLPLAGQVGTGQATGESAFSVSPGALVYTTSIDPPVTQLRWVDRSGRAGDAIGSAGRLESPDLSVDEKRVLAHGTDPVSGIDVWQMDATRPSTPSRFTFDPAVDFTPIWSPDGRLVAFSSNRTGTFGVYTKPLTQGGEDVLLQTTSNGLLLTSWSSDGAFLLYTQSGPKTGFDVWMLSVSDRSSKPILNSTANETQAQLSADGRWLAYTSDETDVPEVYVQPFPPTGAKWQVSTSGGSDPRWRRDGRELFYISVDGKLTAAQVAGGSASFDVLAQQVLFQTRRPMARGSILFSNYKPAADGQRFLVNTVVGETASNPLTVTLDWAAALKP